MQSKRARLDRFISEQLGINRRDVRSLLAQKRVLVDGHPATDINQVIDDFSHVVFDERILREKKPIYVMMNKPAGVVSATKDDQHRTVVDLLDRSDKEQLHIVGRLDFNSTGLLLLTNDGQWSRQLSAPENKVAKVYRVTLEKPVTEGYIKAFYKGMYFPFEGITTRPAKLRIISEYEAEVALTEGRYHQVKRMFGRFRNQVLTLHRIAIGSLPLDPYLVSDDYRLLSLQEAKNIV